MFPILLSLLQSGAGFKGLDQILKLLGGGGSVQKKAEAYLKGRLNAQLARSAAKELAHASFKTVADAMHPDSGLPVTDRIQVGGALARNGALQLAQAAEALLAFSAAQGELERQRGAAGEAAARTAREAAEKALTEALLDLPRVLAGDVPSEKRTVA